MPQTETTAPIATTAVPAAAPVMGFKSSEFLATVATAVSIGAGFVPPQYAPIVAAVSGVYIAARTLLKVVHAMGYAKALPDLPSVPPLPAGSTITTTSTTQVPK